MEDGAKPKRMYLLRPELAQIYNLRRQGEAKAKAIQEYKEKKKKKEQAENDQKKSESDAINNNAFFIPIFAQIKFARISVIKKCVFRRI